MADKAHMVKVEALKYHTNAGCEYQVGDTYEVDEAAVYNLAYQGMAVRVDRAEVAKAQKADADKEMKRRSTAVEPMGLKARTGKAKAAKKSRR